MDKGFNEGISMGIAEVGKNINKSDAGKVAVVGIIALVVSGLIKLAAGAIASMGNSAEIEGRDNNLLTDNESDNETKS